MLFSFRSVLNLLPDIQPDLNMYISHISMLSSHSQRQSHTAQGHIWFLMQVGIDLHASDASPEPGPNEHSTQNTQNLCNTVNCLRAQSERKWVRVCVCIHQRWGTRHSAESYEQSLSLDHNKFLCACKGHLWSLVHCGYSPCLNEQASLHYKHTEAPRPLTTLAGPMSEKKSSDLYRCSCFTMCGSVKASVQPKAHSLLQAMAGSKD